MRLDNTILIFAACTPLLLAGCGTDSPTNGAGNNSGNINDNRTAYVTLTDAGACDYSRYGKEIYVATEGKYYVCVNGSWTLAEAISSSGFNGTSNGANSSVESQSSASGEANPNNGLGICSEANDGEFKQQDAYTLPNYGVYHVCDNGEWREATDSEKEVGFGCTTPRVGQERLVAGYMLCSQPGVWTVSRHTVEEPGWNVKNVGIGTQMWTAYNKSYKYGAYDHEHGVYCVDASSTCGAHLFTWSAAMDSSKTGCGDGKICTASADKVQGRCPLRWHLPNRAEWLKLISAVGGEKVAGRKLKRTSGWYRDGNGDDSYEFSASASGYIDTGNGIYNYGRDRYACFWSSSEINDDYAYAMILSYDSDGADVRSADKAKACSIRCVMD